MRREVLKYAITLGRLGCTNRPFYQIVVTPRKTRKWQGDFIEQVGTFDPIPNDCNEKIVSLNIERIKYWLVKDASVSKPVLELLGLAGLLPIHPQTFITARHRRTKPLPGPQDTNEQQLTIKAEVQQS